MFGEIIEILAKELKLRQMSKSGAKIMLCWRGLEKLYKCVDAYINTYILSCVVFL